MEVLEQKRLSSILGSTDTVKCSLKKENQNEREMVKWYEIGTTVRELKSDGRIEVNGVTLTIKNVQLHDGGTYECRGVGYTRFYTVYVNGEFLKCLESHRYAINHLQRQQHNASLSLGPFQTSNFPCAESNTNIKNLLFSLICIRFDTCKVRRLKRFLSSSF